MSHSLCSSLSCPMQPASMGHAGCQACRCVHNGLPHMELMPHCRLQVGIDDALVMESKEESECDEERPLLLGMTLDHL